MIIPLRDLVFRCRPMVHARSKANGEHILIRPIDKIEVIVIVESFGLKHLKRSHLDLSLLLVGKCQHGVLIEACEGSGLCWRGFSPGFRMRASGGFSSRS
jgi:hypothetical protein